MTREEAIEWMDWLMMDVRERGYNDIVAALSMAIQALEQEPCDDCIKRKYIRKMLIDIDEAIYVGDGFSYEYWEGKLAELPSVQPKRISAKWKAADNYNYRCSKCKHVLPWEYAYCPYCGAKMVEPQESEVSK